MKKFKKILLALNIVYLTIISKNISSNAMIIKDKNPYKITTTRIQKNARFAIQGLEDAPKTKVPTTNTKEKTEEMKVNSINSEKQKLQNSRILDCSEKAKVPAKNTKEKTEEMKVNSTNSEKQKLQNSKILDCSEKTKVPAIDAKEKTVYDISKNKKNKKYVKIIKNFKDKNIILRYRSEEKDLRVSSDIFGTKEYNSFLKKCISERDNDQKENDKYQFYKNLMDIAVECCAYCLPVFDKKDLVELKKDPEKYRKLIDLEEFVRNGSEEDDFTLGTILSLLNAHEKYIEDFDKIIKIPDEYIDIFKTNYQNMVFSLYLLHLDIKYNIYFKYRLLKLIIPKIKEYLRDEIAENLVPVLDELGIYEKELWEKDIKYDKDLISLFFHINNNGVQTIEFKTYFNDIIKSYLISKYSYLLTIQYLLSEMQNSELAKFLKNLSCYNHNYDSEEEQKNFKKEVDEFIDKYGGQTLENVEQFANCYAQKKMNIIEKNSEYLKDKKQLPNQLENNINSSKINIIHDSASYTFVDKDFLEELKKYELKQKNNSYINQTDKNIGFFLPVFDSESLNTLKSLSLRKYHDLKDRTKHIENDIYTKKDYTLKSILSLLEAQASCLKNIQNCFEISDNDITEFQNNYQSAIFNLYYPKLDIRYNFYFKYKLMNHIIPQIKKYLEDETAENLIDVMNNMAEYRKAIIGQDINNDKDLIMLLSFIKNNKSQFKDIVKSYLSDMYSYFLSIHYLLNEMDNVEWAPLLDLAEYGYVHFSSDERKKLEQDANIFLHEYKNKTLDNIDIFTKEWAEKKLQKIIDSLENR